MRVLMFSTLYPTPEAPRVIGGAEVFARRLAEGLVRAGDEVAVVRLGGPGKPTSENVEGVVVHSVPGANIYEPFGPAKPAPLRALWHMIDDWRSPSGRLAQIMADFRPDIIHTNTLPSLSTGIWKVARRSGIATAHTLHDYYLHCPRCSRFENGQACASACGSCRFMTMNRRHNAEHVDTVIGVSRRILDIHIAEGLFANADRAIVYNASEIIETKRTRKPGARPVSFGFIGRLTREKGIEVLFRAFANVSPEKARLIVAGRASDDEQKQLHALAPEADIQFLGFVDPSSFYSMADVVVLSSIWEEPGSLVITEAHAAGLPVLGSTFGGIPEQVEHGVTGWIATMTPTDLAAQIERIASAPQEIATMQEHILKQRHLRTSETVTASYREIFARTVRAAAHRQNRQAAPGEAFACGEQGAP